MKNVKIKEFLQGGIPDVDYGVLKSKTLSAIFDHEEKREQQRLHFMSNVGSQLLSVLLALSVYSFLEEAVMSYLMFTKMGGSVTNAALASFTFKLSDNVLLIFLNTIIILTLNKRFMGLYRWYRFARCRASAVYRLITRAPSLLRGLLWRP